MPIRSRIPIPTLACAAILVLSACAGGDDAFVEAPSYDAAIAAANATDGLVLIDFYATWCGPCKAFAADLESDAALRTSLGRTAFVRVDAESEDGGLELAERFGVDSYPTFVVVDGAGAEIDRWAGYGSAEGFVERLDAVLADPIPLEARVARFETEPTVEDARRLAEAFRYAGELPRAVGYLEQAVALAPGEAAEFRAEIVSAQLRGLGDESFTTDDVAAAVADLLAEPDASASTLARVGLRLASGAERHDLDGVLASVLPRALEAVDRERAAPTGLEDDDVTDFLDDARARLELATAIHVDRDLDRSVELKRASMPTGWRDDAAQLNSFAWWCFEHRTNVEEATELALRGVELAEPGAQRAMILDTAAELCNLGGDCGEALALMERALEDEPDSDYYREQRDRFAALVDGGDEGAVVM
jgi:thioredoxin-like negative regulator of GroEL